MRARVGTDVALAGQASATTIAAAPMRLTRANLTRVDSTRRDRDNEGFMSAPRETKTAGMLAEARLDLEAVRRATELLEAVGADRALLAEVPLEMRQALLIAAGRASRPESYQEKRLVKALRRGRRRK